jgi:predicted MFS family arabinose efflux permease
MLFDAASFAFSFVCLLSIRHTEPRIQTTQPQPRLKDQIGDGLRFVTQDPCLRTLTLWGSISNLGLIGYQSILILFLVRDERISTALVGTLIALMSLGGVIGASIATRIGRRLGTARGLLICELAGSPAALLIPITGPGPRLAFLIAGGIVVGTGVVAGNVLKASWRQTYCPPDLLGRVIASSQLLNYGAIPLGALLAGALATALGTHTSLWIMTTTVALSPLVLLPSPSANSETCRPPPSSPTSSQLPPPLQHQTSSGDIATPEITRSSSA